MFYETSRPDLEDLAREIAARVAGPDEVEEVEVAERSDDLGRPAYRFSFLIRPERLGDRIGLIRIRLRSALGDALDARGDEHRALIQTLSAADWPLRAVAVAA